MTEQEKQLLIKDLCARLPYGIFVKENRVSLDEGPVIYTADYHPYINDCKPYLRPMSSMTGEENIRADADYSYNKLTYGINYAIVCYVDYLYSIHVDCHGLIPKGLALEASEGMYKTKTNNMDITKLMIGDWVYNKHHGKNIRLTAYDFFTHGHDKGGSQHLAPYSIPTFGKDLEPIPLTEDFFEKNGMKKLDYDYLKPNVAFDSNDMLIRITDLTNSGDGYWNVHIDNEDY